MSAPTLEPDTLDDPAIATISIGLFRSRHTGRITNAVDILVRSLDVRCDESGAHPGESGFVLLHITREEVRAILHQLEEDWAMQIRHDGDPNEPQRRQE